MKKFLASVIGGKAKTESKRPTSAFRPAVEDLEGCALMSVVGPELHVNSITSLNQSEVATASSPVAGGQTVMVWTHQFNSSGTDTDIHGQRYDQNGNKLGGEFTIAAHTTRESQPSVAVARDGSFVVVWREDINNSGNTNILAQRFSATGSALSAVIQVANDARREFDPHVAMASDGRFAVSYTLQFGSNDQDVLVRRFAANGAPLAGAQVVANSGLRNEHDSSIAMAPNGQFVVAYQTAPTTGSAIQGDIQVGRFASNGAFQGTTVIANTTRDESAPDVAMDAFGNAVVVYEEQFANLDHDIKARRLSAGGVLGSTINVDIDTDFEFAPSVAVHPTSGSFVVAYQRLHNSGTQLTGPNQMIVREMNANGTVRSTANLGDRFTGDLAINGSGVYYLGDVGFNVPGDPGLGIFARRGILV